MYNFSYIDEITCKDGLPIHEVHELLDEYNAIKEKLVVKEASLEKLSGLYRAIQKRLLLRFKDKNPAPLNNLDLLLNSIYQKVMNAGNEIEALQREMQNTCFKLSFAIDTLLLILKVQTQLDEYTYEGIRSTLAVDQMYFSLYNSDEDWSYMVYKSALIILHTELTTNKGNIYEKYRSNYNTKRNL